MQHRHQHQRSSPSQTQKMTDDSIEFHESRRNKTSVNILLEAAVKCPRDQENAIDEIVNIVRAEEVDLKHLKITLKFYRSLHPITILPVERRFFASGILTEEDITKPCISSFLTGILFEIVTASSSDCAEYCTNVWLER